MKCSKKVLAATVAAAMIATMGASTVFAVTGTTDSTNTNTTVKYEVTQGYEWSIHSAIDFGKDKGVNQTVSSTETTNKVSVTKNIIPDGKKLEITVAGSGTNSAFTIASGNTTLGYAIKVDGSEDALGVNGVVMDVAAGTNSTDKNLTFTLTTGSGTAEVAGSYTGTVTYTASIK